MSTKVSELEEDLVTVLLRAGASVGRRTVGSSILDTLVLTSPEEVGKVTTAAAGDLCLLVKIHT